MVMMTSPARILGWLALAAAFVAPQPASAQGAGPGDAAALYREWTQAAAAQAPDQAAWLPDRRMLAQRLVGALVAGGDAPVPIGELRRIIDDFGSAEAFRFSFPGVCNGSARQVHVFVWDWTRAVPVTDEQFASLAASGCTINDDVRQSFTKLHAIAAESKVSFARLAVYAFAQDDAERERISAEQKAKPAERIATSDPIRIAVALAESAPKIADLPFHEAKALIALTSWDRMGRIYWLPRWRITGLGGAAQREVDSLHAHTETCLATAVEAALGKRRAEYGNSYPAFSALGGDLSRITPQALTLALLHDAGRGWDAEDCLDTGGVYPVTKETSQALRERPPAATAAPPLWSLFNECLADLDNLNRRRLKAGIAEEFSVIGCAEAASAARSPADLKQRLARLAQTRDLGGDRTDRTSAASLCVRVSFTSYPVIIDEQVEAYRKVGAEKNRTKTCAAVRELKSWLAAAGRAFKTYCPAEKADHPFAADVARRSAAADGILASCR